MTKGLRRRERGRALDKHEERAWHEGPPVGDSFYRETGIFPRRAWRKARRLIAAG